MIAAYIFFTIIFDREMVALWSGRMLADIKPDKKPVLLHLNLFHFNESLLLLAFAIVSTFCSPGSVC